MTNFEKYKNEVLQNCGEVLQNLRVANGEPRTCCDIYCHECDFFDMKCETMKIKWLYEEYKEPPVDWSKVEVDTPILVSKNELIWEKRHFAQYRDGKIYAWARGCTSWTGVGRENWIYAKLPELPEEAKNE